MRAVDANVLIRYFAEDDKNKTDRCEALLEKVVKKEIDLYIMDIVIAEVVWVLESLYQFDRLKIRECLMRVLNTPCINFQNKSVISEAITFYADKNVDFIDAYQAAFMKDSKIKTIFSYDADFDKLSDIKREEP